MLGPNAMDRVVGHSLRSVLVKTFIRIIVGLSIVLSLGLSGCGGDNGNKNPFNLSNLGEIQLDPQQTVYAVEIGQVTIGEFLDFPIRIVNVGTADLTVSSIQVEYEVPAEGDTHGDAFVLETGGIEEPVVIAPLGGLDGSTGVEEHNVTIRFTRQQDYLGRVATLTIESDSRSDEKLKIEFSEQNTTAVAQVGPAVLDFGVVPIDDEGERFVQAVNTGATDLIIDGFRLSGNSDFAFHVGEMSWPSSEETLFKVSLPEPIVVPEGEVVQLRVTFSPKNPEAAAGEVVIYANDTKGEHPVTLLANQNVPCVQITPSEVAFGGKLVGTKSELPVEISSCGAAPLKIYGARMDEEKSATDFILRYDNIDGIDPETGIDPLAPLVLEVNESIELIVEYVPDSISPLDAENKPIPDEGILLIDTNGIEGAVEVSVSGAGINVACPIAIATVKEGEEVIPQTTLHLQGDQSYSPSGLNIKNWLWSVEQVLGSTSIFIPSPTFNNPVFEVNVAGYYEFTLVVTDSANVESCEPAVIPVVVVPDEAIHVELLWTTAGDLDMEDEGEGNGSDMDLHFAHPFSNGPDIDGFLSFPGGALNNPSTVGDPWFDTTFDCFWYNKEPNWGTFNPEFNDNPSLDLDDIDGWGPENLNINIPEEGITYRVGVHYWDDHGFGESLATVRVYIYGVLDTEVVDVPVVDRDMWFVAEIPWVAGTTKTQILLDENDAYFMTPNYQNPMFLSQ
jgi:hypothetical protein